MGMLTLATLLQVFCVFRKREMKSRTFLKLTTVQIGAVTVRLTPPPFLLAHKSQLTNAFLYTMVNFIFYLFNLKMF